MSRYTTTRVPSERILLLRALAQTRHLIFNLYYNNNYLDCTASGRSDEKGKRRTRDGQGKTRKDEK